MSGPIVIIGGGVAGMSVAIGVHAAGSTTEMIIVGDENETTYDRTLLSKDYQLRGETAQFRLDPKRAINAKWVRGIRAESIDPKAKLVQLSNDQIISYGSLVIATGASPRRLPLLQESNVPVTVLRTLEDARLIRARRCAGRVP